MPRGDDLRPVLPGVGGNVIVRQVLPAESSELAVECSAAPGPMRAIYLAATEQVTLRDERVSTVLGLLKVIRHSPLTLLSIDLPDRLRHSSAIKNDFIEDRTSDH